ncbi:MAG: YkvA family protein [Oscillospiraceae bacterium]
MTLKEKAKNLKVDIPAVFIALRHPKTPWYAKIIAGVTVAYALSPIDFIPDFVPVLGYLDDLIILPVLISLVIRLIPKEVFEECREKSRGMWADGKPKKWYYALPIVAVWLFIIFLVVKAFIS